jgi:hypothetical protein
MTHVRFAIGPMIAVLFVGCEPSSAQKAPQPPSTSSAASETDAGPKTVAEGGTSASSGTKTLYVREAMVDCEGEGPMKCMQVRESEKDEWTLHYGAIKGFEFQEGYKYQLRVAPENVANPPQGASSKRLVLVEVVSKEKVTAPK